jgi:hypothetical protein
MIPYSYESDRTNEALVDAGNNIFKGVGYDMMRCTRWGGSIINHEDV